LLQSGAVKKNVKNSTRYFASNTQNIKK